MLDHLRAAAVAIAGKDNDPYKQRNVNRLIRHMLADQDDRIGRHNATIDQDNSLEIKD